jgi:hypothetical protein
MEVLTRDLDVQEEGTIVIVDLIQTHISMLYTFGLQDWIRGITMWAGTFPSKVKAIYIVNCWGLLAQTARFGKQQRALLHMNLTILSPTALCSLPSKIQSRAVFVRQQSELHSAIPPEVLPASLGGTFNLDWNGIVEKLLQEEAEC